MSEWNKVKERKFYDRIGNFQSQLQLLTESRDRLLPKLMTGEIKIGQKA